MADSDKGIVKGNELIMFIDWNSLKGFSLFKNGLFICFI